MIAHVAEKGEGRGRVVLRLSAVRPASEIAIEAALQVARAFQSELEALLVEDRQVLDLASFPFARVASLAGARTLRAEDVEREMRLRTSAALRLVEGKARIVDVPLFANVVRGEPMAALAQACARSGPWNVVALTEPLTAAEMVQELFDAVRDTTGIVVVGPRSRSTSGPVIVAIEDIERLPPLLRAAGRIADVLGSEVKALLIGEGAGGEPFDWMEAQARLCLADYPAVALEIAGTVRGAPAAVAETLRRLRGGFVVAQFGGLVVPRAGDLRALTAALECPMLLVR